MLYICFSTFSSIKFRISGFMSKFLVHLDLNSVQGDKYGSVFILLQVQTWEARLSQGTICGTRLDLESCGKEVDA